MSQRELKALGVTTERETDSKSSRSGLVRGVEMDHDNSGERIAELEAELVSAKRAIEEKDQKVQELCRELEETKEAYRVVEQESRARQEKLAMESERSSLKLCRSGKVSSPRKVAPRAQGDDSTRKETGGRVGT